MNTKNTISPAIVLSATLLTGVVTDDGVNCRAMLGDDGELYTFEAMPSEILVGDRLEVELSVEQPRFSICDQGRTIHWSSITRQAVGDNPTTTWREK